MSEPLMRDKNIVGYYPKIEDEKTGTHESDNQVNTDDFYKGNDDFYKSEHIIP